MGFVTILYIILALVITLPIVTVNFYSKKNLPGISICLAISVVAWYLGQFLPIAGSAVIGILMGMILVNFWKYPGSMKPGIKETSKRTLQSAVVLLGFQMNFSEVLTLGGQSIMIILISIAAAFLTAYIIGHMIGAKFNEKTLVGVGTAICGGSAIAAAAPVVKASDKEVAGAISTVFLFNVVAVFIFPLIGNLTGMSDDRFGMWAGAAINDTSAVVSAAYAYSDTAGDIATIVKLSRALMIIPVTFVLAVYQAKKESAAGGFKLSRVIPWFVIAFLIACIINTSGIIPNDITFVWGRMSRFLITMAMVSIGLSTNLKELIHSGGKTVLLGLFCAIVVAVSSLLMLRLMG